MSNHIKIIDDFLNDKDLKKLEEVILENNFPWFWSDEVTEGDDGFLFHLLINHNQSNSTYAPIIMPYFEKKLKISETLRAKVNCYPKTDEFKIHNWHFDNLGFKIALLYLTDDNGYTELKGLDKIKSKKNRLVLFNGDIEHRSTGCTNTKRRVNININYK
tara:strand:+ start:134 stop:613 length:480 start_codon:yes stop_codon:yes gene_type:complete